jgi:hypothetical protein
MTTTQAWRLGLASLTLLLGMAVPLLGADQAAAVKRACGDYATAGPVTAGQGPLIIVFEESHASRLQQVEQAIVFARAYFSPELQLRAIAIEGYLRDGQPLQLGQLRKTGELKDRVDVAVRRLESGDISSAEFAGLVLDAVQLLPIERRDQHAVRMPDKKGLEESLQQALLLVGVLDLPEASQRRALQIANELPTAKDQAAKEALSEELKALLRKNSVVAQWVPKETAKQPTDPTIEKTIDQLEALSAEGRRLKVGDKIGEDAELAGFKQFLLARSAASDTMVANTIAQSAAPQLRCVGMIIGAGHTQRVTSELRRAGRSFVVVTPKSFGLKPDPSEDISGYEAKSDPKAPPRDALAGALEDLLGKKNHKPEPEILKPAHRAESELYQFATLLARGGGKGPPPLVPVRGAGSDPFWEPERWKREFVRVDLKSIAWLDVAGKPVPVQPWDERRGQPRSAQWVVFDVLIAKPGGAPQRWTVKSRTGKGDVTTIERRKFQEQFQKSLEENLVAARDRLHKGIDQYKLVPAKGDVYKVKPTLDVDMVIGKDRAQVVQTNV